MLTAKWKLTLLRIADRSELVVFVHFRSSASMGRRGDLKADTDESSNEAKIRKIIATLAMTEEAGDCAGAAVSGGFEHSGGWGTVDSSQGT